MGDRQNGTDYFDLADVGAGIIAQAEHCAHNDAPATARIVRALLAVLASNTRCGIRLRGWPGRVLEDALPLRVAGGLHWLHLTGAESRLEPVYAGTITDQPTVDALVLAVVADHDQQLLGWFDSPPQTNEAGRSASFMAGLAWLSTMLGPRFELNELGASAGINSMMDRYHYVLGGVSFGPDTSPMRIEPEWRGPPPPDVPVEIRAIHGCDRAPVSLANPAAATRIKAYVWPENRARMARMHAAIQLASQQAPDVVAMDAADFVEQRLQTPQPDGVTRVIHHSIVWQYIPDDRKARITAAIEAAATRATAQRPLAWMMLETNRATFRHELSVQFWPGGGQRIRLGSAQAHGAWVEWDGVSPS